MMRRCNPCLWLGAAILCLGSAGLAAHPKPHPKPPANWPCSDPPASLPDQSWLWAGAKFDLAWRADPAISSLVAQTAQRRTTEVDAVKKISEFAVGRPDRAVAMARVGSGLIDMIGAEYRVVLDGIKRFNDRQAVLAKRMEDAYARLDGVPEDTTPDPKSEAAALQDQVRWDTRIFEDRQRLLPIMCRIPGVLNARLGTLLAAAQENASPQRAAASYLLYVTNERAGEISIIDPASRKEIGRIAVGKRPRGLVASPDHKTLYVALSGSPIGGPDVDESRLPPPDQAADGIAVIDLANNMIVRTLRGISDPEQIAISPDGANIYVSSEDSGKLIILDTQGTILSSLSVGGDPEGVAVSSDGKVVLATSEEDGSVAVIRGGTKPEVTSRIKAAERPRNALFLQNGRAAVPGEFDSSVALIDYNRGQLLRKIQLSNEDRPMGIASAGSSILVTTGRGGRLVKINPADSVKDNPVQSVALVGERPWGLAMSPDGKTAITANGPGNDITMVDVATMRILAKISSPGGPWGVLSVQLRR